MNVTLADITTPLAASASHSMLDATIDAETTRLAVRARAGDADAFCALIDLHHRAARRVARAALGGQADADDAVQEACVTAWQRIGSLEDPAAFRAWLLRITWRKALDRRRSLTAWLKRLAERAPLGPPRLKPQPSGPGHYARFGAANHAQPSPDAFLEGVADPTPPVDEELMARERDDAVAQMIRSLPTRLRDPFLLATAGEHRYEDIAALLGIPVGTVKWRVSEARRVLREKLERVGSVKEVEPRGSDRT
jgi:RNA polymerase sigma-70 factor (ECF subfamily)